MTAKSPEDIDPAFAEAFNAADGETLLSLYEPEAAFVAPTGEVVVGPAAIGAAVGPFFALKPTDRPADGKHPARRRHRPRLLVVDREGHRRRRLGRGDDRQVEGRRPRAGRRQLEIRDRRPGLERRLTLSHLLRQ